jgi:nitrite reductase (NADH) small subunit
MTDWTKICRIDDIPVLGARRVRREHGGEVAVFRTEDDRVFALLDRCPHKGGPLSQGIVFGDHVACPLHNWAISLVDGQARAPDVGCATRFEVRLEAGEVSLRADELATLAITEPPAAADDLCEARRVIAIASAR